MPRTFSIKVKQNIIQRYQSGESAKRLCSELNIPKSTFYHWARLHRVQVTQTGVIVTPRKFDLMRRKLKRYKDMVSVLKTAGCTATAPLKSRLAAAESFHRQYSIDSICEALNVSKGTFYNHILRNKRDEAAYIKRRESLKVLIKTIYDESRQIFGVGKIHAVLQEQGYRICPRTVSRLMREMGLYSIRQTAKRDYLKLKREERRVNLLKQTLEIDAPDKAWVSDITCFKLKDRYYYLCAIIDLYSRKIISHTISQSGNSHLATKTLRKALEFRQSEGCIIHSDRGSPYTSYTFQKLLRNYKMKQSFSSSGNPYDNAAMESFFATIKKEEFYRSTYKSEVAFKTAINNYIIFYNTKRPHYALTNKIPDDVEKSFNKR